MPASLFVEHQVNGLAFYINGELQFHTTDEAIYHEFLVVPAIALAVKRFPKTPLRVLICGGGDGLAAREALKFPEVSQIDLVDYDPDVLELGRTTFAPFNQDSLTNLRVQVRVGEAFSCLVEMAAQREPQSDRAPYHALIGDFTFPKTSQETKIYSLEWFQLVKQILVPGGIVAQNAVSPQRTAKGFWCLHQTILAAGILPKPMQVHIPSFHLHGYGDWGFFMASDCNISSAELTGIDLPNDLQTLTIDRLLKAFTFDRSSASIRHQVTLNSQRSPQLFYYLLNPNSACPTENLNNPADSLEILKDSTQPINFLEIDASNEQKILSQTLSQLLSLAVDPLQLESLARVWLEQVDLAELNPQVLLPSQHPYHTSNMTAEWLGSAKQLLSQIDLSRLFKKMLERLEELPPQIADDLRQSLTVMESHSSAIGNTDEMDTSARTTTTTKVLIMLALTLLVANTIAPDAVFAKGFYSGSGSYTDSGEGGWGWLGLFMLIGGGAWLANLIDENSRNR